MRKDSQALRQNYSNPQWGHSPRSNQIVSYFQAASDSSDNCDRFLPSLRANPLPDPLRKYNPGKPCFRCLAGKPVLTLYARRIARSLPWCIGLWKDPSDTLPVEMMRSYYRRTVDHSWVRLRHLSAVIKLAFPASYKCFPQEWTARRIPSFCRKVRLWLTSGWIPQSFWLMLIPMKQLNLTICGMRII